MHGPTLKKAAFQRSIATLGVIGALIIAFQNCSLVSSSEIQDEREAAFRTARAVEASRNEPPALPASVDASKNQ